MDILEAYQRVAHNQELPPLRRASLKVEAEDHADHNALWARLVALSLVQGWLQFQSHQQVFLNGLPAQEPEWGLLLAAEAVGAEGDSLAVGLNGAGGWRLSRYRHLDHGDWLADEVQLRAHDPKTDPLRYRRYFVWDAERGYVQAAACLIGFLDEEGGYGSAAK